MSTINLHSIRNAFLMRHYPDALNLSQPEVEDYFANKARQAFDDYENYDTPLQKYADFVSKYDFSKRDYNLVKTYIFGKNHRIFVADHNFQAQSTRNINTMDDLYNVVSVAHGRERNNYDMINLSVIDDDGELHYINIMNIVQHLAFKSDGIISVINGIFELKDDFFIDDNNELTIETTSSGKFKVDRDVSRHMTHKFREDFYKDFSEEIYEQSSFAENEFYYTMERDEEGVALHTVIMRMDSCLYYEDIMILTGNDFIAKHSVNDASNLDCVVDRIDSNLIDKYRPLMLNEYDNINSNNVSVLKRPNRKMSVSDNFRNMLIDD